MRRFMQYLVVRTRSIFGYVDYLGPIVSTPTECQRDAERLYGKPGHTIAVKAWSKATDEQKREARESR